MRDVNHAFGGIRSGDGGGAAREGEGFLLKCEKKKHSNLGKEGWRDVFIKHLETDKHTHSYTYLYTYTGRRAFFYSVEHSEILMALLNPLAV